MPAEHPDLVASLQGRVPADVVAILGAFAAAGVRLRAALDSAPLDGMLGATGETNVQHEATQRLDDLANEMFKDALALPFVARLISEEETEPIELGDGAYTCCFDPLDGSSNIGVSSVGSILGVYAGVADGTFATPATGRQLVAAAFVVYGLPTTMVVATEGGVDGFSFDAADGSWRLAFPAIRVPAAKYTSINWTYRPLWPANVAAAVDAASEGLRGRYSGSMVEDVLRVLQMGGVFMYPEDSSAANGKLRMLYEVCPIGMIMEAAGGASSNGAQSVLDVPVTSPHQRSPLIVGAADAVERYRAAHEG
ncbi:MAG: class 1 fructose-bisphosphatase [Dehalococcoidia bacterium]|nr:class 1 fructose-bisphosphatase [Dehalococcoidia bacterium]